MRRSRPRIVRSHKLTRVCVINAAFGSQVSRDWVRACDWFDMTMLLSIIHWFDDPAQVVRDLSSMSARMIIEVPDADDRGACGQTHLQEWRDPLEWVRNMTRRTCTLIGRGDRHTSEAASHIILVEGAVSRKPLVAYWDSQYVHPQGSDYEMTVRRSSHGSCDTRATVRLHSRRQPAQSHEARAAGLARSHVLGAFRHRRNPSLRRP